MAGQVPRPSNVETTNTGTVYYLQEDGSKVIAPSRRPDGTLRKPVRVRAGYTPLEENLYKGSEIQQKTQARGIPGMAPPANSTPSHPSKPASGGYSGGIPGLGPAEAKAAKAKPKPKAKEASQAPKAAAAESAEAAPAAKPENRIRNLRKKLAEIETLEAKAASEALSEAQQEKVARKAEFEAEVKELEGQLANLQI
eukprot:TRINITY_DN105102_c0_g1_i1.p1 TRINITY_DN105102_c0_g1~~TRINITY_DN105102_c0_g1_i1.p1  ORF type:complete len:197 (+),score=59.52 TRINITY_DN105102_c0_g1_i1:110-700(+)